MKYTIILISLLCCLTVTRGETTRVTIRSHCPSKELVNLSTVLSGQAKFLLWRSLEPNTTYEAEVKVQEKKFYTFIFKSIQYDLFLEPGKAIELNLQPDGTINPEGEHSRVNNLLVHIRQQYPSRDKYMEAVIAKKEIILNRERYRFYAKQYQEQLKMAKHARLAQEEKKVATSYIQALFLKNIYKPVIDSKVFGKSNKAKIESDYAVELSTLKPETYLFYYTDWQEYLRELMYTKMQTGKIKLHNPDLWISEWAKMISSPLLREQFVSALIEQEVIMGYFDRAARKRCETVQKWITDSILIQKTDTYIAQIQSFSDSTDVSAVTFENLQGETVSLADFKGKYVFIDFWSTFCNPCIGEMPYLQKLEKDLGNASIEFVSISLDSKREYWIKFLHENQLEHNQFLMPDRDKNPIWSLIGLSGIPRFVLIGPDSRVINKHTYRPSNPILEYQLKTIQ